MEFNELKNEILRRAKEADARTGKYRRAYLSNDFSELMQVIKDNFHFAVFNKVIDAPLIEANKEQFNANQIYCNVDVKHGFLLAWGNATVKASGNATVKASGNASVRAWDNAAVEASGNAAVRAWDNATVEARENATVEARGNATVEASDNSYVTSYCTIECKLYDNAIYRIRESNTVRYASDNIKFEKVPFVEPEETEKQEK
jgi:hypothetical protein